MNEIVLCNTQLPVLHACDSCVAQEAFTHADRVVDFHVLIYVTQGEMFVTEEGTAYTLGAGELLFLKAGAHHYGEKATPRGTSWRYLHFILPQGETNLPLFTEQGATALPTEQSCFAVLPKHLAGLQGSALEQRLFELVEHQHSGDPMSVWHAHEELFALLSQIAFFYSAVPRPVSLADRICAYLEEHSGEPFSSSALEKAFYLSYKTMAARFKREKALTMQQYHTKLRMRAACRLLRSTLLPVGEIAQQLGYADMLYFSRCFRNAMGMSPSMYRKTAIRV